jgi:hypothetical protein
VRKLPSRLAPPKKQLSKGRLTEPQKTCLTEGLCPMSSRAFPGRSQGVPKAFPRRSQGVPKESHDGLLEAPCLPLAACFAWTFGFDACLTMIFCIFEMFGFLDAFPDEEWFGIMKKFWDCPATIWE